MTELDALVGLRFEVSGGLGRMSGIVIGKVGGLYLVQKTGSEHMELLMLDDLRSAKFYEVGLNGATLSDGGCRAARIWATLHRAPR